MDWPKNNNSEALLYQLISQLQCTIFNLKTSELHQLYSEHLAYSRTVTSWRWMIVQIQHNLWMQKLVLTSGWCHAMQAPVPRGHTTFFYFKLSLQNFMTKAYYIFAVALGYNGITKYWPSTHFSTNHRQSDHSNLQM